MLYHPITKEAKTQHTTINTQDKAMSKAVIEAAHFQLDLDNKTARIIMEREV